MNRALLDHCIEQVRSAPMVTDPFPHIVIDPFLPSDTYAELIATFPPRDQFSKATYAGAGFRNKASNARDYGLVLAEPSVHPLIADLIGMFESDGFSRSLLQRFQAPLPDGTIPIPQTKRTCFEAGACDYHARAHLHLDLPGYEIPPHPDAPRKIITWLLYATASDVLRDYGTILCKPRDGQPTAKRPRMHRMIGEAISRSAELLRLRGRPWYQRLCESSFGFRVGLAYRSWLPWELFDLPVKIPALPNCFAAFAPSYNTYHAVRFHVPPDAPCQQRPVLRGFVWKGREIFERVTLLEQ
jgi:hypothetical protein